VKQIPICEKLERKVQVLPAQGSGFVSIDSKGRVRSGSAIRNDGKRLANPDGPEAAAIIKELVEALSAISDDSVFNQQRFAEDTDADYFLRCFKAVKERARAALTRAQVQP
jgi:hypothetical protein